MTRGKKSACRFLSPSAPLTDGVRPVPCTDLVFLPDAQKGNHRQDRQPRRELGTYHRHFIDSTSAATRYLEYEISSKHAPPQPPANHRQRRFLPILPMIPVIGPSLRTPSDVRSRALSGLNRPYRFLTDPNRPYPALRHAQRTEPSHFPAPSPVGAPGVLRAGIEPATRGFSVRCSTC